MPFENLLEMGAIEDFGGPVETGSAAGPGAFGYVSGVGYTRPRGRADFSDELISALLGLPTLGRGLPGAAGEETFVDPETQREFEVERGQVIPKRKFATKIDLPAEEAARGIISLLEEKRPSEMIQREGQELRGFSTAGAQAIAPKRGGFSRATIRQEKIEEDLPSEQELVRARRHFAKLRASGEAQKSNVEGAVGPVRRMVAALRKVGVSDREILGEIKGRGAELRRPDIAGAMTAAREEAREPFHEEREEERRERIVFQGEAIEGRRKREADLKEKLRAERAPDKAKLMSFASKIVSLRQEAESQRMKSLAPIAGLGQPLPKGTTLDQVVDQLNGARSNFIALSRAEEEILKAIQSGEIKTSERLLRIIEAIERGG